MRIIPVKTRVVLPPKDNLWEVFDSALPRLEESDVVAVTSKIVSIGEGRCIKAGSIQRKRRLIQQEAEYLARVKESRRSLFSIKGNLIVGSSGIDDSNGNGYWVLWPRDPFASARGIWSFLRTKRTVGKLGVVITDSVSPPMRLGCIGAAISFFGFHPVERHIGKLDIFGHTFRYSRSNLVDGIAAAAVLAMGETNEQTPLAIIRGIPTLRFCSYDTRRELLISPKQDIYYPLLKPVYEQSRRQKMRAGIRPAARV